MRTLTVDWLSMETEMREVLGGAGFEPGEALACLDEILARYTRRGNCRELAAEQRRDYENRYPRYFDWGNEKG